MPIEVILPKVDMDMETGTIEAWHVKEGDQVRQNSRGQVQGHLNGLVVGEWAKFELRHISPHKVRARDRG